MFRQTPLFPKALRRNPQRLGRLPGQPGREAIYSYLSAVYALVGLVAGGPP